jgi:hypothetical protein
MKLVEHARKGSIMDIKEDYYIYKFKKLNKLIEEQKSTKDNNQNNLFDIALGHECTPTVHITGNRDINTPQNTPETSASSNSKKTKPTQKVGTK